MNNELAILDKKLLGKFISRFSLGDTWEMFIGEYCLSAHTIEFTDERRLELLIKEHYDEFAYSIDKENIAKSMIMAANLRKTITRIDLDEMKNLTFDFEQGTPLRILTNTEIVDWQWCINKSGKDPYMDNEVSCFWAGAIEVNNNSSSI